VNAALKRLKSSAILALPAGCSLVVSLCALPAFIRQGLSPIYEDETLMHVLAWIGVCVLLIVAISSAFLVFAIALGRLAVSGNERGEPEAIRGKEPD
jgi:drug/metabolite transporter (DMT)-like permease